MKDEKIPDMKKLSTYEWELPKNFMQGMRVPGRIIASQKLLKGMDQGVFNQLANVASMPGICKCAYCMPDGHWGYGFPIGGVAAFDFEKEGVISPGSVGFDIGCGMRLIRTNLKAKEVIPKIRPLVDELFKAVPAGVGSKGFVRVNRRELEKVMVDGVKWAVDEGYGIDQDIKRCESMGAVSGAKPEFVSDRAAKRGAQQLGTLGSGNHYLEVQVVDETFDQTIAKKFGLENGNVAIMVHCGSRGFGHQVATDYLKLFDDVMKKYNIKIPDRELSCAPIDSKEGQQYIGAMACAANSAFVNRQVILHRIREVFMKTFNQTQEDLGLELIYDVAHNIAKAESYKVDGKKRKLMVHRKGATRSFGPDHPELAKEFKSTGQPVILGGSMETGSHLLVGTKKAEEETFGTTAHGSGRTMSRRQAKQMVQGDKLQKDMEKRGIYVRTCTYAGLAEEAGLAYKDINDVVDVLHNYGISKKVVKLRPIGNVKG
ncbi:RNA-splicing ligase RtcB [archaeon]|nr:RNA-splicing ligase RtcB [archaeon]|tara:strand:- start:1200 stop:2657 length:1458 start_codon:yes stop_codon:yes gene_type:complete